MEDFYTEEYGYPEDITSVVAIPTIKINDSDNFFKDFEQQQPNIKTKNNNQKYIINRQQGVYQAKYNTYREILQNLEQLQEQIKDQIGDDQRLSQKQLNSINLCIKNACSIFNKKKDKEPWSSQDHAIFLELYLQNKDDLKQLALQRLNKSSQQITSHLQKCEKKIAQVFSQYTEKFDTRQVISSFQSEFNNIEKSQQRQKFIEFFTTKVAIYKCKMQGPITIDIVQQAMQYIRQNEQDIPYGDVTEQQQEQEYNELLYAIAGIKVDQEQQSPRKIFVYPEYNPQEKSLDVRSSNMQFQTRCSPMGCLIKDQKSNSVSFSFNCNFIVEQCYRILERSLEKYEFNQFFRGVLVVYGQVIENGNTFEFSTELVCNKWQINQYRLRIFMFCLKCILSM